ncbi:MAG TPA: helix-turn-helix domain-containing protein [Gaiellaceae bacterium]|nr:helix-turn-helix domain-containing protein [Gaiellaceae bacterium]
MEASPIEQLPDLTQPSGIGERLRAERQRKGMTVREIARRVNVSPSLISQIERDKVNPSVSTLWALVTVLGLQMGDLFSDSEPPVGIEPVQAPAADGPVTAPGTRSVINLETGVHWERLTAERDAVVEFLTVTYPPNAASCDEDSLVRHGGKEYGYVISGRLGVRIGFDEYELGPGMAVSFDSSAPHRLWAIGDQPAEAIWVVVGRQNDNRGPLL